RRLANEAIDLDPGFGLAYSLLGWTYLVEGVFGWSQSPEKSLSQAVEFAKKAIALQDLLDCAHGLLAYFYSLKGEWDRAVAEARRAVEIAPNSERAHVYLGQVLIFAGRPVEAIPILDRAIRLNPFPTTTTLAYLGLAHLFAGHHEEAISMCKKAMNVNPKYLFAHIYLTATYSAAGRDEEAHAEAQELLKLNPKFYLDSLKLKFKKETDRDLLIRGLRKAGLE
ncbi:MAG: tetratricopeptide repeat protein, partial [Deltaproteobacteria bacterium]